MASPSAICRIVFPILALLTVGYLAPGQGQPEAATELINKLLAEQWKGQKLQAADKTSDAEFIRRVSLDLIGRIPTSDEVQAFEKDAAADKRAKLVDQLLNSPEHAAYWATLWTNWLMPTGNPTYRAQLHLWLEESLGKNLSHKDLVSQLLAGTGKTNDHGRVNFVLSQLGEELKQPAQTGRFDAIPVTSRSLRVFLGYRLNYDLPEKPEEGDWQASQFWGVNAFFRQADRLGTPSKSAVVAATVLELRDNPSFNESGKITYPIADGKSAATEPIFLDARKIPAGWKGTRREALAELLTTHPNFAKAQVNRVWGELFGRGLHERPVVDDFGSKHKVVHADLLDGLAKAFIDSKYDTRKLLRAICLSDAYQSKSTSNASNVKPEQDVYFSRMPLRVLRPEQLTESALVALGVPQQERQKLRPKMLDLPLPPERDWDELPLHERLIHAVGLLNRREVHGLLTNNNTKLIADAGRARTGRESLNHVYLATLGRPASNDEYDRITKALPIKGNADKGLEPLQDVIWAILNSSEFILNH